MSFKLFFCGDIVNVSENNDFTDDKLKKYIKNCDLSVCNFEAPIKSNGCAIPKAGPHLFQSVDTLKYLKLLGFDLLSLANNHIYDYGEVGLSDTINEIKLHDLQYVGADLDYQSVYQPIIIEIHDQKVGFISAAEAQFGCLTENCSSVQSGYAWINNNKIDKLVLELKNKVDWLILLSHAGAEMTNVPLPEWRDRYKYLCDIGVDIVIGHHTHTPQGYEYYNNSYIFYSLGNFFFDSAGHELSSNDSFSVMLEFGNNDIKNLVFLYHKRINNKTTLVNRKSVNFTIEYLNNILNNNYYKYVNELVLSYFHKYYLKYYQDALVLKKGEMKHNQGLLLLHNIKIESHRYIVQRALSKLYEEDVCRK